MARRSQIDNNQINNQLRNLYDANWDNYCQQIRARVDAANPYLMTISDEYLAADRKVVIYGQETYGWGGEFYNKPQKATIENLMKLYHKFVICDEGYDQCSCAA